MAFLMNKKKLHGLLGDDSMTLSTDPRTDPRMLEGLAKVRLDVPGDVPPVSLETPMEQLYEYALGVENFFQLVNRNLFSDLPSVDGVDSRVEKINGPDGNEITLYIHQPKNMEGPLPCVYHTHGGGMVILSAKGDNFVHWRSDLAASGLVVVGVEFRNGAG